MPSNARDDLELDKDSVGREEERQTEPPNTQNNPGVQEYLFTLGILTVG